MLSIVTPSFNSEKYIRNCVDSVRHACAGTDYEHLIADGGSTDKTLEILKEYPEVSVVSESDQGMYDALNKAIKRAKGTWIGHLNSDEQYNKKGLQMALTKIANQTALDAIMSPTIMLNGQLDFLQLFKQVIIPKPIDALWCMPIQSCSFLYKKSIWERVAYDTSYHAVADHVWFRKQMELGINIGLIPEPIGIFTWHANNISNTTGVSSGENALPDINRASLRLKWAKHVYRLKKWIAGGYSSSPISYEYLKNGRCKQVHIEKPALKVKQSALR